MNILHVSGVTNWGGGENHLENLYSILKQTEPEVNQYILCVKHADFYKRLKSKNFDFLSAPLDLKVDPRYILKIKTICSKYKIDIVHVHDPTALTLCVLSDRLFKSLPPFIYSKKTSFPIKDRKSTLYKYNYKKIKKVICVSEATKQVASKSIVDQSKLITIYDGIKLDENNALANFNLREKYNIEKDSVVVGTIGNHIRAKNLDTFIEVVNDIVNTRNIKKFHFIQIGNFTERTDSYLKKVKDYHLEKHMTFTGFLDNASSYLSQLDIFLLTSQSEGLPQVINEAFFNKIPVVSTNVGGIPEIIKHGDNGFLANAEDYKALANHIIEIANNKTLTEQFTSKSYKQLIERFSSETMAERTLNVYKSICKKKLKTHYKF